MACHNVVYVLLIASLSMSNFVESTQSVPAYPNATTNSSTSLSPSFTVPASITRLPNGKYDCPPCAINANAEGLQQIIWFNSSIGLTLDTVSVYVTTYNGSNATAVTRTSTHYGNLNTVNVTELPEAQSIITNYMLSRVPQYVNVGSIFLARGTDGALDSTGGSITSLAWPTAYVMVSSIAYSTIISNTYCPSGLQRVAADLSYICDCGLIHSLPSYPYLEGMNYTMIGLPSTYYAPVQEPDAINFSAFEQHGAIEEANFDVSSLGVWLKEQSWATSRIPNFSQCVFQGPAKGPPGIKIPFSALTATVSTTIHGGSLPTPSPPKPAGSPVPPSPTSTATSDMSPAISQAPPSSKSAQSVMSHGTIPSLESVAAPPTPSSGADPRSSLSISRAGETTTSIPFEPSGPVMHSTVTAIAGAEPQSPSLAVHNGGSTSLPSGGDPFISVAPSLLPIQPGAPSSIETSSTQAGSGPSVSSSLTSTTLLNTHVPTSAETKSIQSPSGEENPSTQHPIATVAGHTIDFLPQESHIIVHGVTQSLHLSPTATPIAGTAGVSAGEASGNQPGAAGIGSASVALGQTVTPNPMPVIVADKTVTPNGQAITISGTPVSLGSSGLVIGTSTVPFPKQAHSPQPVISTLNGDAYTAYPTVTTDKAGSTDTIFGALATISGTTIYPTPPGKNSPSPTYPNTPVESPIALITMHGQTYTIQNSAVQIAGVTVSEGAPATTISNTVISLGTERLVIGSSTLPYSATSPLPSAVAITMNGETYTIQDSAVQIAGATVSEGAPATTISNTPVSLGPSNFILGSSTISYSMPPTITINNEPLNLESSAVIVAGSITVSEGAPAVTVSGTAISLGSAEIVVGASTLEYSQAAGTQSSGDVAAAIMSALGRTDAANSGTATAKATTTSNITSSGIAPTTSPQPFTGGAGSSGPGAALVVVLVGMGTWLYALGMV